MTAKTIRRLVKCPICGNIKVTYAKKDFFCCKVQHEIEPYLINSDGTKPINQNNTPETAPLESQSKQPAEQAPVEQVGANDLEIESDEPENPLDNLPEEKKEFHCPNCNNQLNEYQTPCPKCFYDIEWQ